MARLQAWNGAPAREARSRLRAFGRMLKRMPWIRAVMWSQLPSRGNVHRTGDGIVDSDVQGDPVAAAELRKIILDGAR